MKVAAIIFAIAVAGVSAKQAADKPLDWKHNEAAVRANAAEAGKRAADSALYTVHALGDVARETDANLVRPSVNVVEGGATGTAHKGASYVDSKIADILGTASFIGKKLGQGSEKLSNAFYNSAAANSRRYDNWKGAEEEHDDAAAAKFEQAKAPIRHGAENVKNAASDAKAKAKDVKNDASDKLHARKEDAKAHAEHAKDKTVDTANATGNKLSGMVHNFASKFGHGVQKTGEVIEDGGETIKEKGAHLREREGARAEERTERANLILRETSGASTVAMSSAAIAVASAAAVYLI